MSQCYPSEILKFLQRAKAKKPQLFSSAVAHKDCVDTLGELYIVFSAWTRLEDMRNSSCKWSEADWASQVYVWSYLASSHRGSYSVRVVRYNLLRSPAGKQSTMG